MHIEVFLNQTNSVIVQFKSNVYGDDTNLFPPIFKVHSYPGNESTNEV